MVCGSIEEFRTAAINRALHQIGGNKAASYTIILCHALMAWGFRVSFPKSLFTRGVPCGNPQSNLT